MSSNSHSPLAERGDGIGSAALGAPFCGASVGDRAVGAHDDVFDDHPHEECGIVAIDAPIVDGFDHQSAQLAFFGLFALQHRGQEAAGIAVADGGRARLHKDVGLVNTVFTPEKLEPLVGRYAIGHTRYSTQGSSSARNAQPFLVETMHGPLAVAHNGNLVNASDLRDELLKKGFGLTATSDTEVVALMLACASGKSWEERIERTMPSWTGAYSLVVLGADRAIAVRDPWGFRPLSLGKLPDGGHALASETCALRTLGCVEIREVEPGEIVTLIDGEVRSRRTMVGLRKESRCSFEFVYFSRPDSEWAGQSIHAVRQRLGEALAREAPADADVVIAVPDSSTPAAIGYGRTLNIPVNDGLIKNRYIGRTFIEPTQHLRERRVAMKFNALESNLRGKRVVMIDDSLVRGTTAGPLVKLLRDAGATEVHVRITCPPVMHPCHMGVDMGSYDELIAHRLGVDELRTHINADSLAFLSNDAMVEAIGIPFTKACTACFTGGYPIELDGVAGKTGFEAVLA